jgi:hypothetical protein
LSPSPKSADCIIATNAKLPEIDPSSRGAKEYGIKRTDGAECQYLARLKRSPATAITVRDRG